jgi:glycosyltransferase involved in cell wall biosynthesis
MPVAISIVLPVRNGAATIERALESIARQTFLDWELIVVDDGSTDATPAILQCWASREPRVHVLSQPATGIVAALEIGLAAARGEFIARMDADDEAHPARLERQLDLLQRDGSLGVVSSLVRFGGDRVAQAGYARYVDWINTLVTPEEIARNRFVESPLAHPSVMFRRTLVSLHGGYRSGPFPEDYELWLRWLDAGVRMTKICEELLIWHDPPSRLSRSDPRYGPDRFFAVKAQYLAVEIARALARRGSSRVFVWGAGRPTRKRAELLTAHGLRIDGYVDIDPRKIGRRIGDRVVLAPADLPAPDEAFVLGYVASLGARELIRAALAARGYREGENFLMCA